MRPWISIWLAGLFLAFLFLCRTILFIETSAYYTERRSAYYTERVRNATILGMDDRPQDLVVDQQVATAIDTSQKNEAKVFPRICLEGSLHDPIWEWLSFGTDGTANETDLTQKRLLIATYSAFGQYAKLLELTSPINKAYAKRWKHDIVVLQGASLILPWDENCTPPEERSRFNKVDLLLEALYRKDKYEYLLLLDADTLIYDFSYDIPRLFGSNDTMLVAQRTHQYDPPATDNINNGITLWNLHHRLTQQVAEDWNKACREGIPENRPYRGDQYFLRQILHSEDRIAAISTVWDEFYYRDATVVKHFQRSNNRSWNDTGLDTREERILNATKEICVRFGLDEQHLERRNYTALT